MINNRYGILRKVGEGGSGEVYVATDRIRGGYVAMKVFHPGRLLDAGSIEREFGLLRRFEHPNLIRVFEFEKVHVSQSYPAFLGRYYYTMEYFTGSDALRYFEKMPNGPEKALLLEETFIQTLLALESIHREEIIHFDIKPQNIFVVHNPGMNKSDSFAVTAKL